MDVAVARIHVRARASRLAWYWPTLWERWFVRRRQIMQARHLRHGW